MGDGTFGSQRLWSYANRGDTASDRGLFPLMAGQIYIKRSSPEPDATSDHWYDIRYINNPTHTDACQRKLASMLFGNIFGLNINMPDTHA